MKALCVSDTVAAELYPAVEDRRVDGIDLVLSCGDLPPEYLNYLAAQMDAPVYYVRGNHDIRFLDKPPLGCVDAHAGRHRVGGLQIVGLEGSRWYNGGPMQYTEAEMTRIVRRLHRRTLRRGGVDVVITHAPPRGIHDAEDPCHQGFEIFRWLIERHAPRFFVHGHIHTHFSHPDDRITVTGGTRVVNSYGYCLLEIDPQPAAP